MNAAYAAFYLRVSDPSQGERVRPGWQGEQESSLETQDAACRKFCAARSWTPLDPYIYVEKKTGTVLWERDELMRLVDDMRRDPNFPRKLVILDTDRLGRDSRFQTYVLLEADHAGVSTHFVLEPDFDKSPEAELVRYVKSFAGFVELGRFKERVQRGRRARVKAGRLMHAWKPRYGYQWRDESKSAYDVDPLTAPVVQRIFHDAVVLRLPANQIAQRLYADGIPTPLGKLKKWRPETIINMFRDPAYVGRAVGWRLGERKTRNGKPANYIRPESEWVPLPDGTTPALVDEQTWLTAQGLIESNAKRRATYTEHPDSHLLRGGLATCGMCGGTMIPDWPNGLFDKRIYRCSTHKRHRDQCRGCYIRAELLDQEVWDWVRTRLADPKLIQAEVERMREDDPTPEQLAATDRALAQVGRKVTNLSASLADEDDADMRAEIKSQLATMLDQRRRLEAERAELLERQAGWQRAQVNLDAIEDWQRTVQLQLGPDEPYANKRQALDAVEARIKVYRKDAPVRWSIDTTIGALTATATGSGRKSDPGAVIHLSFERRAVAVR